jgi:hypothetical protein
MQPARTKVASVNRNARASQRRRGLRVIINASCPRPSRVSNLTDVLRCIANQATSWTMYGLPTGSEQCQNNFYVLARGHNSLIGRVKEGAPYHSVCCCLVWDKVLRGDVCRKKPSLISTLATASRWTAVPPRSDYGCRTSSTCAVGTSPLRTTMIFTAPAAAMSP